MNYECIESRRDGGWAVEAIDFQKDGQIYRALFTGPDAQGRANDYMLWKNSKAEPQYQHQTRKSAA
jgi:hypothetical protein